MTAADWPAALPLLKNYSITGGYVNPRLTLQVAGEKSPKREREITETGKRKLWLETKQAARVSGGKGVERSIRLLRFLVLEVKGISQAL